MESRTQSLIDLLREARLRKGWSQRDVSQRARLTQAQLSRIESGAADLRLSTFVELARILDLEPVLAPRTALAGVNAVLRELESNQDARTVRGLANRVMQIVQRLERDYSEGPLVERLKTLAQGLHPLEPLFQAPGALGQLIEIVETLERRELDPKPDLGGFKRAVDRLADLRNSLFHQTPATERPAYALDEED